MSSSSGLLLQLDLLQFSSCEITKRALADRLVLNGFHSIDDLRECDTDPSQFIDGDHFTAEELSFISAVSGKLNKGFTIEQIIASRKASKKLSNASNGLFQLQSEIKRPCDVATVSGPKAEIRALEFKSDNDASTWLENRRIDAIIGASPSARDGILTAVRCSTAFVVTVRSKEPAFPPKVEMLQAWSAVFRYHRTFGNYVSLLKTACHILQVGTDGFDMCLISRARLGIQKRGGWQPKARMFIRGDTLLALSQSFMSVEPPMMMLFIVSYFFLLRVPSEAIPMVVDSNVRETDQRKSVLVVSDKQVTLHLKFRKNIRSPTTLTRNCCCNGKLMRLCPVHVVGAWARNFPKGGALFNNISPARANATLKSWLSCVGHKMDAHLSRTHDLRRGRALDL